MTFVLKASGLTSNGQISVGESVGLVYVALSFQGSISVDSTHNYTAIGTSDILVASFQSTTGLLSTYQQIFSHFLQISLILLILLILFLFLK